VKGHKIKVLRFKGTSKNVIPAPACAGVDSSRNSEPIEITGLPHPCPSGYSRKWQIGNH